MFHKCVTSGAANLSSLHTIINFHQPLQHMNLLFSNALSFIELARKLAAVMLTWASMEQPRMPKRSCQRDCSKGKLFAVIGINGARFRAMPVTHRRLQGRRSA